MTANPVLAANWYRKAAEGGNPLGEYDLGDMYLRGNGMPQNDAEAFRWFQKAAAQGHTGARIKLGYMYAEGRGTKSDLEVASSAGDERGQ